MRACKSAKAFLVISVGGHSLARQPRRSTLGKIAGDLHLAREGEHVGIKPETEDRLLIDLACLAMGFGLFAAWSKEQSAGGAAGRVTCRAS